MAQLNPEPSMEDILASIKRIIAEDSEIAVSKSSRARREMASAPVSSIVAAEPEGVEEDETPEPAPVAAAAPAVEPTPEPADILELTSPLPADEPAPAPVQAAPPPPRPEALPVSDHLMSDPAAQASRSAFAALAQLQVRAEAGQENTLEGLVADLLRPMLREWLDRELPAMVERMVAAEIGRISGRA